MSNVSDDSVQMPQPKPASKSLIGAKMGYYTITEFLGRGGMAVVYKAHDDSLDRDVALKILSPQLSQNLQFEERFTREARNAAKLDHPNIVQIHAADRFGDTLYMAMQYVKGKTLDKIIREKKCFEVGEALQVVFQCADALEIAHSRGLIHRDIKPSNIMIDENGKVKITDFGLSRSVELDKGLTQTGLYLGTPEYSSPEQCETQPLDGRADIYSLGVVFYEMLSGKTPYESDSVIALFKKISEERYAPIKGLNPNVPDDVAKIVDRMMAKNRDDRYPTVTDLKKDIQKVIAGGKITMPTKVEKKANLGKAISKLDAYIYDKGRKKRRLKSRFVAFTIGLLILIGAAFALYSLLRDVKKDSLYSSSKNTAVKKGKVKMLIFSFDNKTGLDNYGYLEEAMPELIALTLNQYEGVLENALQCSQANIAESGRRLNSQAKKAKAEELGEDAYITGEISYQDKSITVLLYLYNTAKEDHILNRTFSSEKESGILDVVDTFAKDIIWKIDEEYSDSMAKKIHVDSEKTLPTAKLILEKLLPSSYQYRNANDLFEKIKLRYRPYHLILHCSNPDLQKRFYTLWRQNIEKWDESELVKLYANVKSEVEK